MFNLISNIEDIVAEMQASEVKLRAVNPKILQPKEYLPMLTRSAEAVLSAYGFNGDEASKMTATIMDYLISRGMGFHMGDNEVEPGSEGVGDFISAGGNLKGAFSLDDILSWVAENKVKTERDQYVGGGKGAGGSIKGARQPGEMHSDLKIAQRILAIINGGDRSFFEGSSLENPTGLGQWLVGRHPEIFGSSSLTSLPESVAEALQAVLEFWFVELGVEVHARLRAEIDRAFE